MLAEFSEFLQHFWNTLRIASLLPFISTGKDHEKAPDREVLSIGKIGSRLAFASISSPSAHTLHSRFGLRTTDNGLTPAEASGHEKFPDTSLTLWRTVEFAQDRAGKSCNPKL